jgi:methylmalonyl-CoA mutase
MDNFFSEFAPQSLQAWQKSATQVLKGKPLADLDWQVDKDLQLAPLYAKAAEAAASIATKGGNGWEIVGHFQADGRALKAVNEEILAALANGCQEIVINLGAGQDIAVLLDGVWTDMLRLSWQVADLTAALDLVAQLAALPKAESLCGHIHILQATTAENYTLVERLKAKNLRFSCYTLSLPDADSIAAALAQTLKSAENWLRFCQNQGLALAEAVATMQVQIRVDNLYFVEIAKIRAFKRLWLALLQSLNATAAFLPRMQAQTSSQNDLNQESRLSLLAATNQALAAAIAGIDALYICPPTGWEGIDETTACRLARNIQHILQHESHLDAVADPAAGSYYIENATQELTTKTWTMLA